MYKVWLAVGFGAALMIGSSACGSDDCSSNADCPSGRICRLGLCALDPNLGDGTGDTLLPDVPLNCEPATAADLVLNEILADPPAGADPDGNSIPSTTEDEFVEVVNISSRAVAMTNAQIDIGGHKVTLGSTCLPSNQARVVFGSSGLPSLTNTGGSVSLLVDGVVVQTHTYGSEGGKDQSLTLMPQLDKNGVWVSSGDTWGPAFSPGFCSDLNAFPNCGTTPVVEGDVETVDGQDSETVVANCTAIPTATDLIVNEIMADPGTINDSNQDGVVDSEDDEFIEVVNIGSDTFLLDGVKLRDASNKDYAFPAGTCLAPDQAVVVFQKYEGTGSFPGVITLGKLGFAVNNTQETISIIGPDSTVFSMVSTGSLGGADQSITRATDLDPTAVFVNHSSAPNAGGRKMSPGYCQTGAAFPDCGAIVVESDDVVESSGETVDDTTGDTGPPTEVVDDTTVEDTGPTCGPVAIAADLVINEALLDPPTGYDANGDGTASTTLDEFVEVVNIGTGTVSIGGLRISDALDVRYTVPAGTCLGVHEALVVFGNTAAIYTATGKVDLTAPTKDLSLNNSGETVSISMSVAEVLQSVTFAEAIDQSWVRSPDTTGTFVKHKTVNASLPASPGQCIDGTALPGCLDATP